MTSQIILENMRFYAHHGLYDEEQTIGNEYIVSLAITVDCSAAGISDSIDDTLNYEKVFETVKQEMRQRSRLLENVSMRILKAVKKLSPSIEHVELRLSKLNPPFSGQVERVSLVMKD